jgi:hypothetical protein
MTAYVDASVLLRIILLPYERARDETFDLNHTLG